MNCELIKIEAMIPKEIYDRLVKLTKRQNANLSNNIGSLIEKGIDSTYEKWPMLADQEEGK